MRPTRPASAIVPAAGAQPPAVPSSLAPTAARAAEYAQASRAPNTQRAYRGAWKAFAAWCEAHGLVSLPAAPQTAALYVTHMADRAKPATIDVHIAGVAYRHREAGHPSPFDHPRVQDVLDGVRRTRGTAPNKKTPAVSGIVRSMVTAVRLEDRSPYVADRDDALLLLGFAGAFRRSELVALDWVDLEERPEGLLVTIRRGKTDQRGAGRKVHVHRGADPALCPVAALGRWRARVRGSGFGGADDAPVFLCLSRSAWLRRMSAQHVALVVKAAARAAGLDAARFAGHSLRSGFATSAARAGRRLDTIRAQTGHRSLDMLAEYLAHDVPWDDDAAKGLL